MSNRRRLCSVCPCVPCRKSTSGEVGILAEQKALMKLVSMREVLVLGNGVASRKLGCLQESNKAGDVEEAFPRNILESCSSGFRLYNLTSAACEESRSSPNHHRSIDLQDPWFLIRELVMRCARFFHLVPGHPAAGCLGFEFGLNSALSPSHSCLLIA